MADIGRIIGLIEKIRTDHQTFLTQKNHVSLDGHLAAAADVAGGMAPAADGTVSRENVEKFHQSLDNYFFEASTLIVTDNKRQRNKAEAAEDAALRDIGTRLVSVRKYASEDPLLRDKMPGLKVRDFATAELTDMKGKFAGAIKTFETDFTKLEKAAATLSKADGNIDPAAHAAFSTAYHAVIARIDGPQQPAQGQKPAEDTNPRRANRAQQRQNRVQERQSRVLNKQEEALKGRLQIMKRRMEGMVPGLRVENMPELPDNLPRFAVTNVEEQGRPSHTPTVTNPDKTRNV